MAVLGFYFPPESGEKVALGKVIIENSAVGDFYGTGIEIWSGFEPNG